MNSEDGATQLVGGHGNTKNKNKLQVIEKHSLIPLGLTVADLKDKFLLTRDSCSSPWYLDVGKVPDNHVLFGMVREIKMMNNWFGCIFVTSFSNVRYK